mgnify:CR=1 FL=1
MIENGNLSPADFSALMGNNRGFGDGQGWWIIISRPDLAVTR